MELTILFAISGIIIFIGFLSEYIFDKTSIPDVFWLILFGLALGQFYDLENTASFIEIAPLFTTFALIFILFGGALNIDITKLLKGVGEGGSMAFFYFVSCMAVITASMMSAGWGVWESLLMGAILGGISSDVIIPLSKKISIKPQTALDLTLESAISDVFCIVGALTIVNIMVLQSFSVAMVLQKVIYSFVFAALAGVVFAVLWIKLLPHMDKFTKSYMTTIAALLILYGVVEMLEASGALACLAFGIVVGNSKKIYSALKKKSEYNMDDNAKFFYSEISFFLKTFFFVYLGLIINLQEIKLILLGVFLTVVLFFVRPVAVSLSKRKLDIDTKSRTYLEVMNPKGLSAAVLAQLPLQYGLMHGAEFATIVMSAIVTSVLLCLLGVYFAEKGSFTGVYSFFIRPKKESVINKETN